MAIHYDEFSLFSGNAEELGIPYVEPRVRRIAATVDRTTGQQISALLWGDHDASDVELVLIHGGAQNAHTWDSVALALGGGPLLAIDMPGHGHSSHRDDHAYWPHENAVAVARALEAFGTRPKLVVGMSMGGLTSIALGAHAPHLVPALVLVDVTPGVDQEKASAIHQFVDGPEFFESFQEILDRTILFNPTRSEASLRRGVLHNAVEADDGRWRWRYDLPRRGPGAGDDGQMLPGLMQLWDQIGSFGGPLTLVRGATSPVVSDEDVAELQRRRPDARVIRVEGAGHSVQGDKPMEMAQILRDLL